MKRIPAGRRRQRAFQNHAVCRTLLSWQALVRHAVSLPDIVVLPTRPNRDKCLASPRTARTRTHALMSETYSIIIRVLS